MSEIRMKECGWCGEEITDDKYFTLWIGTKLVGMFVKNVILKTRNSKNTSGKYQLNYAAKGISTTQRRI